MRGLEGVRVLELGELVSAAYAAKLQKGRNVLLAVVCVAEGKCGLEHVERFVETHLLLEPVGERQKGREEQTRILHVVRC